VTIRIRKKHSIVKYVGLLDILKESASSLAMNSEQFLAGTPAVNPDDVPWSETSYSLFLCSSITGSFARQVFSNFRGTQLRVELFPGDAVEKSNPAKFV
jgi:hypothetical protein